MRIRMLRRMAAGAVVLALVGAGCGGDDDDDASSDDSGSTEASVDAADLEAVATTHADLVHVSYSDATAGAEALGTAVEAFLAAPSDDTLSSARQAWLDARDLYGPTEAFR